MADRLVPCISLKGTKSFPDNPAFTSANLLYTDFENRKAEITQQLINATENSGFLTLIDHGISMQEIETQFATSKAFFDLPHDVKGKTPHSFEDMTGWEYMVTSS